MDLTQLFKKEEKKQELITVVEKPEEVVKHYDEFEPEPIEELEYQKILREHGGIESNVPLNSPYWRIRP